MNEKIEKKPSPSREVTYLLGFLLLTVAMVFLFDNVSFRLNQYWPVDIAFYLFLFIWVPSFIVFWSWLGRKINSDVRRNLKYGAVAVGGLAVVAASLLVALPYFTTSESNYWCSAGEERLPVTLTTNHYDLLALYPSGLSISFSADVSPVIYKIKQTNTPGDFLLQNSDRRGKFSENSMTLEFVGSGWLTGSRPLTCTEVE